MSTNNYTNMSTTQQNNNQELDGAPNMTQPTPNTNANTLDAVNSDERYWYCEVLIKDGEYEYRENFLVRGNVFPEEVHVCSISVADAQQDEEGDIWDTLGRLLSVWEEKQISPKDYNVLRKYLPVFSCQDMAESQ